MIPGNIVFGFWDGSDGKTPPFLSIPGGEYKTVIFENRWDVDIFIEKVRFFQNKAFGGNIFEK